MRPPMHKKTTTNFSGPFVAVPLWAVEAIFKDGHASHLQVLTGMVSLMERRNQEVTTSVNQLADHVNLSRETVKRSLKWLIEYGILSLHKRSKTSPNVYRIHYVRPSLGSPMTLVTPTTRVTHDPSASPTRVTHDPSKTQQPLVPQGKRENTIDSIRNTDTNVGIEGASTLEVAVILGADPDDLGTAEPTKKKRTVNELSLLVGHFVQHPTIVMTRSYGLAETNVIRRAIKLLLNAGLSRNTITQMIDKFYSVERFRNSERSVFLFSNKNIQSELLDSTGGMVDTDDPVLTLMQMDFDRGDLNLPWPQHEDDLLRRAIIFFGIDVCYRYPELVASLAYKYAGNFSDPAFTKELGFLNELIIGITNDHSKDSLQTIADNVSIPMPKELATFNSKALRQDAGTIAEAVYRYRRS